MHKTNNPLPGGEGLSKRKATMSGAKVGYNSISSKLILKLSQKYGWGLTLTFLKIKLLSSQHSGYFKSAEFKQIGKSKSIVYKHIKALVDTGVLFPVKTGVWKIISLDELENMLGVSGMKIKILPGETRDSIRMKMIVALGYWIGRNNTTLRGVKGKPISSKLIRHYLGFSKATISKTTSGASRKMVKSFHAVIKESEIKHFCKSVENSFGFELKRKKGAIFVYKLYGYEYAPIATV